MFFQGHFPPPTTPEELGARILIQERYEKYGESEEVEMEVESEDEEDEREKRAGGQPSQPDQDTQVQDMDEVNSDHLLHLDKVQHLSRFLGYLCSKFTNLKCYFSRDQMMRTMELKLHFHLTTPCHLLCPRLQTTSSFEKTMIPKVHFFL